MNITAEELNELIRQNRFAVIVDCTFCRDEHCRDCAYLEMENDFWNDGTRRCSQKGRWVSPSDEACGYFKP